MSLLRACIRSCLIAPLVKRSGLNDISIIIITITIVQSLHTHTAACCSPPVNQTKTKKLRVYEFKFRFRPINFFFFCPVINLTFTRSGVLRHFVLFIPERNWIEISIFCTGLYRTFLGIFWFVMRYAICWYRRRRWPRKSLLKEEEEEEIQNGVVGKRKKRGHEG